MRGVSWLAADQLASQEGLYTMEWVSKMLRAGFLRFEPHNVTCNEAGDDYDSDVCIIRTLVCLNKHSN